MDKILQTNDGPIFYERVGQGPKVLLIQGVGVASSGWLPQTKALAKSLDMVSFDNRGLKRSTPCTGAITIEAMAKDAEELVNLLDWKDFHVVGHSMGGLIAQQLAMNLPKRIKSLSLLCTFAKGTQGARLTPFILWMGIRTRLGTKKMRRRATLEMILPKSTLKSTDIEKLAEQYAQFMGRDLADSPAILMKQLRAMSKHNAFDRLSEIKHIPTLIICGELDPIANPEFSRQLKEALPSAKMIEIPSTSHALTIERYEEVNNLLEAFILDQEA